METCTKNLNFRDFFLKSKNVYQLTLKTVTRNSPRAIMQTSEKSVRNLYLPTAFEHRTQDLLSLTLYLYFPTQIHT